MHQCTRHAGVGEMRRVRGSAWSAAGEVILHSHSLLPAGVAGGHLVQAQQPKPLADQVGVVGADEAEGGGGRASLGAGEGAAERAGEANAELISRGELVGRPREEAA